MMTLDFDRLRLGWESVSYRVAGPEGLGRLQARLRDLAHPWLVQLAPPPGANVRPQPVRYGWLSLREESPPFAELTPLQFRRAETAMGPIELQRLAYRYPALFHACIHQSLSELRTLGLEQVWLADDRPAPARLTALACRAAHVPTVLFDMAPPPSGVAAPTACDGTTRKRTIEISFRPQPDRAVVSGPPPAAVHSRTLEDWLGHLLGDDPVDGPAHGCVATHDPAPTTVHVPEVLGFASWKFKPTLRAAAEVDLFYKWGVRRTLDRTRLDRVCDAYDRPLFIAEDGLFLRSLGLGVGEDSQRALSVTVDTKTAYYDATRPSRLEDRLNAPTELSETQRTRAKHCMEGLAHHRLSKYNQAPYTGERFGSRLRPKVLLLDQRHLDSSVRYGLASALSFDAMLAFVARERPDHDLLLKRHPDATLGGARCYFSDRRIHRWTSGRSDVFLIDDNVNPHTLLEQVEEVFVVTSGFGFEALMAGVKVHCFGAPFYSGWGLTEDHQPVPRRLRQRSVVDLFHHAAIEATTYWSPEKRKRITMEEAIERMALERKRFGLR